MKSTTLAKRALHSLVMYLLAFLSFKSALGQNCNAPKTYTVHDNGFSPIDSFYMQPYFIKFNAPVNNMRTKILIQQLSGYPNYDIKLYRDSCNNLPGNLLTPTLTVVGDTAVIYYANYARGIII